MQEKRSRSNIVYVQVQGADTGRLSCIEEIHVGNAEEDCRIDLRTTSASCEADELSLSWARVLLEDRRVVKVMHDCRMIADSLLHAHNIHLSNVHDTTCWHRAETGRVDCTLQEVLRHHGIEASSEYGSPLLWLRELQCSRSGPDVRADAMRYTEQYLSFSQWADVTEITVRCPDIFVGENGKAMGKLAETTNTCIIPKGRGEPHRFLVFYCANAALFQVWTAVSMGVA